ncbi:MAG: RNA polymerase sigma-70 factor [Bacteroidales bacterium]|nr:RNA polymerase sigma-70 factor [Bacteroidales bacterium]
MSRQTIKERNHKEWNLLFQSIYEQYYAKLCVFAASILNNEEEAEEIVQNVIYKLWEKRDSYDSIENLSSYLFRSVKNHCINTINHKKTEEKYLNEAWTELKSIEIKSIEYPFEKDNKEEQLHSAIQTLPERCKEVLSMSKFEGLKNKEIAEQLNISVKAVEANITRAFSLLRKTLSNKK